MRARFLLLTPALLASALLTAAAAPSGPLAVSIFNFEMINTSLEPTSAAERARLRMLDETLRQAIAASPKFRLVPLSAAAEAKLAEGEATSNCNDCELEAARASGADYALTGTVQKVSNLILNINLYLRDDRTGQPEFVKSVDIRGNTDESWHHGLGYLLRNYLLTDEKG